MQKKIKPSFEIINYLSFNQENSLKGSTLAFQKKKKFNKKTIAKTNLLSISFKLFNFFYIQIVKNYSSTLQQQFFSVIRLNTII